MSYRLELGLALLLAAGIGVAVFAANRTPKPAERDARTSTLLSGPEGSQALYRVMVRLGRRVERRRTPLFSLAADTAPRLLVVLDPPLDLTSAEIDQVVQFVQGGGAVLAAGHGGGILRCVRWRLQPDRALDDSVAVRPPQDVGAQHAAPLRLPHAARVLAPRARPRNVEGLVKRERAVSEDSCGQLIAKASDTLVAAVNGRPVVLRLHYAGGGSITLAADVGWFRNQVWRDTDVPHVVLPLLTLRQARRGRVVWDEYHQGFGRESAGMAALTWDWTLHSPAGWAILQLVAVGLLWLAMTAVRFGPARSVIERRRRSPLEHLEALGAGLESAADSGTAVHRIVAGLRRRLSRTGHPAPDARNLGPWLETLELATTSTRGRAAVRRLRHLVTQRGGAAPERALDAAQAVEDVWEELRPRTTRDAF